MRPPRLARRTLLRGAAALGAGAAAAGCATSGTGQPPVTPSPPDPQTLLLRRLIADKEETIALYRRAAADDEALRAFQRRHETHLAELRRHLPQAETARPAAPSGTPAAGTATATPARTPEKVTVDRLREREREAAASRLDQLESVSPSLAQLLASIGACEAAHALALSRSP